MKITTTRIHKTKSQKKAEKNLSPITNTERAKDAHLEDKSMLSNFWENLSKKFAPKTFEGASIRVNASMANDNDTSEAVTFKKRTALCALCIIAGVAFAAANTSSIATQAIMNADERVLDHAMNTNPQALAFALNAMNVGE